MLLHERPKVKREREREREREKEKVCACTRVHIERACGCLTERERHLRLFILNKAANDVNGVSPFHAIIKKSRWHKKIRKSWRRIGTKNSEYESASFYFRDLFNDIHYMRKKAENDISLHLWKWVALIKQQLSCKCSHMCTAGEPTRTSTLRRFTLRP